MKRTWRAILALTLVCAVALTAAAVALGSKALPLTMTDACTIGDPAAAEGLHMAARIGMEQNRLQWRMDYDPAADTTDASFRLAYSDRSGQWIFDGYGYNIQCLLADQEDDSDPICREVLRQARASGEAGGRDGASGGLLAGPASVPQQRPLVRRRRLLRCLRPVGHGDTVPFPALSIPVRESDDLTVALARNADGSYELSGYDFTGISAAMYFTPFSLPLEGGTLTTLGIDPAAQLQPDWAPEGYGLWYVPVQTDDDGSSTPVPSRRQLVYPLDITRQQVVTLKQEKLGGTVYLMTQEDGQLVLRLLEGGTRLLQELSLGPVPESDPGTGGYHTLTIRDGFAVVLWEDQLTVLSRTEEGYHLDYTCPTQTAYVTGYTVSFTDPEPEKQDDEDAMPYTVAPNFAMAYQDGKLAVAAYIGNSSMVCVLLLEVYGPEGLLYATARVPSVGGSLPPTMSALCGCGRTRRPPSRRRISPPPSRSLLGEMTKHPPILCVKI